MKSNNVQNNTRKIRSPARRSKEGRRRRTKNTRGIKKRSKKKNQKSKKIFHKGVWLRANAGNNYTDTKRK